MENKNIARPSEELLIRVRKATGSEPISWVVVRKGYTTAERYIMKLENGSSVFVKVATDEDTTRWLRSEYKIYGNLKADFLPKLLAWEDGERSLLILEDLSGGFWPPPWSQERITRVMDTLKKVATIEPPPGTQPVKTFFKDLSWQRIAADPSGFLGLNIASSEWLAKALPVLIKAEREADFNGDTLVHMDVRSDNICFSSERTLLVDWNWASAGTQRFDLIAWLPSLHSEGGPAPWDITLEEPELISAVTGYFASQAYRPPPRPGSTLRQLQLALLKSSLPWSARALDLPLPE
ncbi:MAG: aminoglycoside phosphotransferase family protein [Candidatus Liptonbacteria bacterium]|nr:aminoglycoside phosphotransferase family protein [Candidatus Liptonbacteria bacterium]